MDGERDRLESTEAPFVVEEGRLTGPYRTLHTEQGNTPRADRAGCSTPKPGQVGRKGKTEDEQCTFTYSAQNETHSSVSYAQTSGTPAERP